MQRRRRRAKINGNGTVGNLGFVSQLWKGVDKLRDNLHAAEYKCGVLGIISLEFISNAFEEHHAELAAERSSGADAEDPDEYRATEIIPEFSTVVGAGTTTVRMAMLGSDMVMNQTCDALHSSFGWNFSLYCQIRQVMDVVHRAHGSIFNTITTNNFQTSRFVLVPSNIFRAFENGMEPMLGQILGFGRQSRPLALIRETLLPKLLSGQIRIEDSQKFVESLS